MDVGVERTITRTSTADAPPITTLDVPQIKMTKNVGLSVDRDDVSTLAKFNTFVFVRHNVSN